MDPKINVPKTAATSSYIEVGRLPHNLQQKRALFDKDNNGFVEGQAEMDLLTPFAQELGLDLNKYKTNCWKIGYPKAIVEDNYPDGSKKITQYNTTYDKTTLDERTIVYLDNNGNINRTNYFKHQKGKTSKYACSFVHRTELTNGQNSLQKVTTEQYDGIEDYDVFGLKKILHDNEPSKIIQLYTQGTINEDAYKMRIEKYFDAEKKWSRLHKASIEECQLNGKPVQAKPIGKGRYEVTTEQGKVYYISHDGFILKPEYVRQNP